MWKRLPSLTLLVALNVLVLSCVKKEESFYQLGVQGFDGGKTSLNQYQGRYILLHFWATWCAPCLAELPEVVRFLKGNSNESLQAVLVNLDQDRNAAKKALPAQLSSNIVLWFDPEMKLPEKIGSFKYPETYLLGKSGEILYKWVGPQEWGSEKFRTDIFARAGIAIGPSSSKH